MSKITDHINRKRYRDLPACAHKEEVIQKVFHSGSQITLVEGGTGSGKTTKVPMMLVDYLDDKGELYEDKPTICVTQPRKLPAMSGADFINSENKKRKEHPNYKDGVVGSWVRFKRNVWDCCKMVMMTDGILMQQVSGSKNGMPYKIVVIDEAHERGVNSDVLLGLLKDKVQKIKDFKLIIMSATLNTKLFLDYFNLHPEENVIHIQGNLHQVHTYYTERKGNYIDIGVEQCLRIHCKNTQDIREKYGDILFFLPGRGEIEKAHKLLEQMIGDRNSRTYDNLTVHRLFAGRKKNEREAAIAARQAGRPRRIILSTNVAESSITIDGVKYIIDCGYVKKNNFKPTEGFTQLAMETISRASANQRKGRAGRTCEGYCYRLYSKSAFEHFEADTVPEILRDDVTGTLLKLYNQSYDHPWCFEFLTAPKYPQFGYAIRSLIELGCIEKVAGADYAISDFGSKCVQLPLDPEDAASLIRAEELNVADPVAKILAIKTMLDRSIFTEDKSHAKHRRDFAHGWGDHFSYLNVMEAYHESLIKETGKTRYLSKIRLNYRGDCKKLFDGFAFNTNRLHDAFKIYEQLMRKLRSQKLACKRLHPHDSRYYQNIAKALIFGRRRNIAIRHSNKAFIVIPHLTMKVQPAQKGFLKCIPSENGLPAMPAIIFFDSPKARDCKMEVSMASFCHPFWLFERENDDPNAPRLWADDLWKSLNTSIRNYIIAYLKCLGAENPTKCFCKNVCTTDQIEEMELFIRSQPSLNPQDNR